MDYEERIRIMDCGCHYDSATEVVTAFCKLHDTARCPKCKTPHRLCRRCITDGGPEDLFVSNATDQARLQPSPEADCSASVVSKGPGGYSPCGGCSPESTSDYTACDGCRFNPDKPNKEVKL